jgi:hypothetical protein
MGQAPFFLCVLGLLSATFGQSSPTSNEPYLSWTTGQASKIGASTRATGKIGGAGSYRVYDTDRAIDYKLRATWLTPEVIRASARLEQLRARLTDAQTRALVAEADAAGDMVVMVEIDPNEGSGVVPLDWRVCLQPKGRPPDAPGAIQGIKSPQLRGLKALSGVVRRDYNYDVFWVVFPLLENGVSLLPPGTSEVELLVGIYNGEGRVRWPIPDSIKAKFSKKP